MKTLKSHLHLLVIVVFGSACSISLNREPTVTELGSHQVSVRPSCQNSSTGSHNRSEKDGTSRILYYEFKCDNTTILIRDRMLTVNSKSYGTLNEGDQIAVDYGKVRVNREVREEVR